MKPKFARGVTLIEMLIVASMLVFLAMIALWYFRSQIFKANDAKRKADLHRIQVAVEEYEKDHNCYPPPELLDCNPGTGLQPYIQKIPCDPTTGGNYVYTYDVATCPTSYHLYATLEVTSDPDANANCNPPFNYAVSSPNVDACTGANLSNSNYYGCKSGACVPIQWDSNRPGPECDPNYLSSTCYNQCGTPGTECQSWQ